MSAIQQVMSSLGALPGYTGSAFINPAVLHKSSLYVGTGTSDVTVTTGVDLATYGGMVLIKNRSTPLGSYIVDTARGGAFDLDISSVGAQGSNGRVAVFSSTGVQIGGFSGSGSNAVNDDYSLLSFRKNTRFFDQGSYAGNGANRTIAHSLGVAPGMIIVKRTDVGSVGYNVWMQGMSGTQCAYLDTATAPTSSAVFWNSTLPTSSVFSLGGYSSVNGAGGVYSWWAFANDSASDGVVQCGTYTGNASATGPTIALGWEPDLVLIRSSGAENWRIFDSTNGLSTTVQNETHFYLNGTAVPQAAANWLDATATGFQIKNASEGVNSNLISYYYMAIRRT